MIDEAYIGKLIGTWENQSAEFKLEFTTDPVRKSLVAFSNDYQESGGGVLVFGVNPKTRAIEGIESEADELMQRITGLCRDGNIVPSIAPSMHPLIMDGKTLLIVQVPKSGRRPHRANNICYIRIGSENQRATPDEEFELIRRTGQIPYDLSPVREARLEDLDLLRFTEVFLPRRVSAEMLSVNGRSPAQWLEHLKLAYVEGGNFVPTVTAILLFGRHPQSFLPHSSIDFIRFEGEDASYDIADRKEISGTLEEMIKASVELVERYTIQGYQFSSRSPVRTDVFEYPVRAIREAIANAVVHRDYEFSRSQVSVKMFDDRVEIFSPGGLFGIVTAANFGTGINDYRNPDLAVGLNVLGLVEKAGTGILQIKRQMRENGSLEPQFEIGDKYLLTKLPAHPYYQGVRLYQKALHYLESEAGNADAARLLLQRTIALYPSFAEAWGALARLETYAGNPEKARGAFQKAIELHPQYEKAYLDWAKMEEIEGNLEKSRLIYQQATVALPSNWLVLYSAGLLELRLKDGPKAASLFQQADRIAPGDPRILRALGDAWSLQRQWKEAARHYYAALDKYASSKETAPPYVPLLKSLINQPEAASLQDEIKAVFEASLRTGVKAHELFSQYYRYATQQGLHAEALRIQELAQQEGIPPLTPYEPEINLSGLPVNQESNKLVQQKLLAFLQQNGFSISKANVYFNAHNRKRYAILKAANEHEAQRLIQFLNNATFEGRRLTARPNVRNS
jgi:ATP-dependent DNA helicase RecG